MFYESLRKLGKDVLRMPVDVDENLLERLLPTESDSKWYRGFFGDRDKWTTESLVSHLKNMHGSSNMKVDKKQEQTLGFIVAHVRSNRYSPMEMQAIIKVWVLLLSFPSTLPLSLSLLLHLPLPLPIHLPIRVPLSPPLHMYRRAARARAHSQSDAQG